MTRLWPLLLIALLFAARPAAGQEDTTPAVPLADLKDKTGGSQRDPWPSGARSRRT